MNTTFDIGEKVNIEAVIEEIDIYKDGIMYKAYHLNTNGDRCTSWYSESQLKAKSKTAIKKEDTSNAET